MFRVLILLAIICLCLAAYAYPTLNGDTGLMQIPTADAIPITGFQIAGDIIDLKTDNGMPMRLTVGKKNDMEVFITYFNQNGGAKLLGGGMKKVLWEEIPGVTSSAIAVGARSLKNDNTGVNAVELYAVGSKIIMGEKFAAYGSAPLRGHLGLMVSRFSGAGSSTTFSAFGGVSISTKNGDSFMLDYMPEIKGKAVTYRNDSLSAAVRLKAGDNLWLQAGNSNPFGLRTNGVTTIGVMYEYGDETEN
ncbi:MAG: hypothetical protein WCO98_03605 [bacterium]